MHSLFNYCLCALWAAGNENGVNKTSVTGARNTQNTVDSNSRLKENIWNGFEWQRQWESDFAVGFKSMQKVFSSIASTTLDWFIWYLHFRGMGEGVRERKSKSALEWIPFDWMSRQMNRIALYFHCSRCNLTWNNNSRSRPSDFHWTHKLNGHTHTYIHTHTHSLPSHDKRHQEPGPKGPPRESLALSECESESCTHFVKPNFGPLALCLSNVSWKSICSTFTRYFVTTELSINSFKCWCKTLIPESYLVKGVLV